MDEKRTFFLMREETFPELFSRLSFKSCCPEHASLQERVGKNRFDCPNFCGRQAGEKGLGLASGSQSAVSSSEL